MQVRSGNIGSKMKQKYIVTWFKPLFSIN